MRVIIGCLVLIASLCASEHAVTFFLESEQNQLLCREAEFSYRVISQKNAEVVTLEGHHFFRLIKEDRYLTATGCSPLTGKREAIVF
jgi:hypothetical protein